MQQNVTIIDTPLRRPDYAFNKTKFVMSFDRHVTVRCIQYITVCHAWGKGSYLAFTFRSKNPSYTFYAPSTDIALTNIHLISRKKFITIKNSNIPYGNAFQWYSY